MAKKNQIERKCKNCKLFNSQSNECAIVILVDGEKILPDNGSSQGVRHHLPVLPEDYCFFEQEMVDKNGDKFTMADQIGYARFFVEDEYGNRTDGNGKVKVEYTEGFFGKEEPTN